MTTGRINQVAIILLLQQKSMLNKNDKPTEARLFYRAQPAQRNKFQQHRQHQQNADSPPLHEESDEALFVGDAVSRGLEFVNNSLPR